MLSSTWTICGRTKSTKRVLTDQADLGLVSYPEGTKDLAVIPWREEEMAVAAPPSHPLAEKAVLVPADLDGQDFIGFDEDLSIRRELDRFLREQGIEIRMTMQFDNIQMIKEAVALGSGISILPARTMQAEIAQGGWSRFRCTRPSWCGRWASCTASASASATQCSRSWSCYWSSPRL